MGNVFKAKEYEDNPKDNGTFVRGRLNGYGEVMYVGGDRYIGMFKDGKRSGKGRMIFNQYNEYIMDY